MTAADDPALVAVFASTREAEMAVMPSPAAAQLFAQSQMLIQRRAFAQAHPAATESAIVDDAGAVIGRLIVSEDDDAIRLLDIALLPAARGHGGGRALITELQERARALGLPLVLHVEHARPAARRLYEQLGFTETARDQLHAELRWLPG